MPERLKLSDLKVKDVMELVIKEPGYVTLKNTIIDLLKKIIEDPRKRHVYVVDENMKLIGVIRMNYIVQYLFPFEAMLDSTDEYIVRNFFNFEEDKIEDIMNSNPRYVKKETQLGDVAKIFMEEKINELPVVDDNFKLIGQINVFEIITAYLNQITNRDKK